MHIHSYRQSKYANRLTPHWKLNWGWRKNSSKKDNVGQTDEMESKEHLRGEAFF
jgi:hypothetical protein